MIKVCSSGDHLCYEVQVDQSSTTSIFMGFFRCMRNRKKLPFRMESGLTAKSQNWETIKVETTEMIRGDHVAESLARCGRQQRNNLVGGKRWLFSPVLRSRARTVYVEREYWIYFLVLDSVIDRQQSIQSLCFFRHSIASLTLLLVSTRVRNNALASKGRETCVMRGFCFGR